MTVPHDSTNWLVNWTMTTLTNWLYMFSCQWHLYAQFDGHAFSPFVERHALLKSPGQKYLHCLSKTFG